MVSAITAFDPIIPSATPNRVVSNTTDHGIGSTTTADDDMVSAGVLQEGCVLSDRNVRGTIKRVSNDEFEESFFGLGVRIDLIFSNHL